MTVKIGKYTGLGTWGIGDVLTATNLNETIQAVQVPIGGIIPWHKTFVSVDSGTTTSTSANHLVQTGQNFLTTVNVGNIVFNSTDSTFAYVTTVNSDTDLTLSSDIMATTEAYTIYATPRLPDNYIECNGQAISNSLSPYNGGTAPSLNGTTDDTKKFLRGVSSSATGGAAVPTHNHAWHASSTATNIQDTGSGVNVLNQGIATYDSNGDQTQTTPALNTVLYTNKVSAVPTYFEVVYVMRIY